MKNKTAKKKGDIMKNEKKKSSLQERHRQLKLAQERDVPHLGLKMPSKSLPPLQS